MSVIYSDFLEFAKSLPYDSEINNRNSASRAYYAAFNKCRDHYGAEFEITVKGGTHEQLIRYIGGGSDKKDKEIAYQLMQARKLRTTADYELTVDFNKSDRITALIYAEAITKSCK